MAKLLKLRRGTTAQHSSFTGAEGEVTVDTDKESLVVHNGSTAAGFPLAREDMSNVSSASIAGRLATDSIAPAKIGAGTLPTDVTVASANIVDGTIVNADINASAAITLSKLEVITSNRIVGNDAGNAVPKELSAADVRTIINVEDGATADQSNAEIRAAVEAATDSNVFTDADHTKLNAIEANATADQTAAEILTAIKTVDGAGSGLDADTLDGVQGTNYAQKTGATCTGDFTFSGGAGAVGIAANSDIRLLNGTWTGDHHAKLQHHDNTLYIGGGTAGVIFRDGSVDRWQFDTDGHLKPSSDSNYDIGLNGQRVRNIYADTLYGDGSNLTGVQPFPSGTKMLFQQTAAPTGWTKITSSVDNRALRLVSGTVGSGGNSAFTTAFASYTPSGNVSVGTSGNSTASFSANATTGNSTASFSANATTGNSTASFSGNISGNTGNSGASTSSESTSGTVNNHTLSTAQMPSHSHSFTRRRPDSYASYGGTATNNDANSASNGNTHNTGGGGSHSHGFSGSSHSHNVNNHTHSFSGSVSGNTGNHTHTVSVSGNTGNHTHTVSVSGNTGNHTHSGGSGSFSGSARDFAVQYIDVIVASKD